MCIQVIIYYKSCVCTLTKHHLCNAHITLTAKQISNAPCAALSFRHVELREGGCIDSCHNTLSADTKCRLEKKAIPPICRGSNKVQYLVEWRHEGLPNRTFLELKVEDDTGPYAPKCYRGEWLQSEEHDCCFGHDYEGCWRHVNSDGQSKRQFSGRRDNPRIKIENEDDFPRPRWNLRSKAAPEKKYAVLGSTKVTKSPNSSTTPSFDHGTVTQIEADKLANFVTAYAKDQGSGPAEIQQTFKEVQTSRKAFQASKSKSTHKYSTRSARCNEDSGGGSSTMAYEFEQEDKDKQAVHDIEMTGLEIGVNSINTKHRPQYSCGKSMSFDVGTKGPSEVPGGAKIKTETNKSIFNVLPTKYNNPPINFTDSFYVPDAGRGAEYNSGEIMALGSAFDQSMTSTAANNQINAQARGFEPKKSDGETRENLSRAPASAGGMFIFGGQGSTNGNDVSEPESEK